MRKYLKFIVLLLITAFIFWFFGRNLDWQEVGSILRAANPVYLILAVACISLGYFLRSVRWGVLLEPITKTSLRELFATTTVGFTAVFSWAVRARSCVRCGCRCATDALGRRRLVTIMLERVFDLASLFCFFSISLIWFTIPPGREAEFETIKFAGNVLLGVVVAGIVALYIYHRKAPQIIAWSERFTGPKWVPARLRAMFLSLLKQLAAALDIFKSFRHLAWVALWTTALWLSIAVPTWLVITAFGVEMRPVDSLFVMGVASLGSLIPTPGGAAGAFHAATAGSLILLGIPSHQAAAISIIMHLVYFAPAVVFGLYYFFHGDISWERFRSLLSSENAEREIKTDSPDFVPEG